MNSVDNCSLLPKSVVHQVLAVSITSINALMLCVDFSSLSVARIDWIVTWFANHVCS